MGKRGNRGRGHRARSARSRHILWPRKVYTSDDVRGGRVPLTGNPALPGRSHYAIAPPGILHCLRTWPGRPEIPEDKRIHLVTPGEFADAMDASGLELYEDSRGILRVGRSRELRIATPTVEATPEISRLRAHREGY